MTSQAAAEVWARSSLWDLETDLHSICVCIGGFIQQLLCVCEFLANQCAQEMLLSPCQRDHLGSAAVRSLYSFLAPFTSRGHRNPKVLWKTGSNPLADGAYLDQRAKVGV